MTPTLVDFSQLEIGDLIFATVPYGVEFTFPAPFTLLDPGMAWMRCTQLPVALDGFPIGTQFVIARGIGTVQ